MDSHLTSPNRSSSRVSMGSADNPGQDQVLKDCSSTPVVSSEISGSAVEGSTCISFVSGVKERYNNIVKREHDKKEYRGLLLTNRLKVLLVSQPHVAYSATALEVQVGSYSDPDEIPGLAHFCEHMLFLGTKKYPEENTYEKFLSEHGGSSNAVTRSDSTIFYFDVAPPHLEKALDMFAQFFISPLFTESATNRELNAVHSEHEMKTSTDSRRLSHLDTCIADPEHPYKKFTAGNKETLQTIPESKGIDVRKELLKFHKTWYSSNIMSLVVIGKESLDELEAMVVPLFSTIEDKSVTAPSWPLNPIPLELRRKKIYGVPIQDTRYLSINFAIPCTGKHYKTKPADYLTHLINHEGPGSLQSALRRRGWSNKVISWKIAPARGFAFFFIEVDMTTEGMNHTDDIVSLIFQYLAMLNKEGPQHWLWEEQRKLSELDARFKPIDLAINRAKDYAALLQDYPMEDIITMKDLVTEWKPELITELLSLLTPENVVVKITAKAFADKCIMTDRWYGTKYGYEDIDESTLKMWKEVQPCDELHLPPPNEFIPSTLSPCDEIAPAIIKDTQLMRFWYKKEDVYVRNNTKIMFDLISPLVCNDPCNLLLTIIWKRLIIDCLQETTYSATLAGLDWSISSTRSGLNITVEGYDEKIDVLLELIIDQLVTFKPNPMRLPIIKEEVLTLMDNLAVESQPSSIALFEQDECLSDCFSQSFESLELFSKASNNKKTQLLADLTLELLDTFVASFIRKVHIEGLMYGELSKEKAIKIADSIEDKFPKVGIPLSAAQLMLNRAIELDKGTWYVRKLENDIHQLSCASVYYACGTNELRQTMILKLLLQLIKEPCFNTLRTEEQLGYVVDSESSEYNGAHGLRISVQGERHPEFLDQRIEKFVQNFSEVLQKLSDEELSNHIATATADISKDPSEDKIWKEIQTQVYNFNRARLEVEQLNTITKEDLITFYKKYLSEDSPDRAKLSIYVISTAKGGAGDENLKTTDEKQEISSTEDSSSPAEPFIYVTVTVEGDASLVDFLPLEQGQNVNVTLKAAQLSLKLKNMMNSIVEEGAYEEDSKPAQQDQGIKVAMKTDDLSLNLKIMTDSKVEGGATGEDLKPVEQEQVVKVINEVDKVQLEIMYSTVNGAATGEGFKPADQEPGVKVTQEADKVLLRPEIITDSTVKEAAKKEDLKPLEQDKEVNVTQKADEVLLQPEIIKDSTVKEAAKKEDLKPLEQDKEVNVTQEADEVLLQPEIITDSTVEEAAPGEDLKPLKQEQGENVTQKIKLQPEIITNLLEFKSQRRLYPNATPFMNIPRKGI